MSWNPFKKKREEKGGVIIKFNNVHARKVTTRGKYCSGCDIKDRGRLSKHKLDIQTRTKICSHCITHCSSREGFEIVKIEK